MLKNIESYVKNKVNQSDTEYDLMSDVNYITKSCSLITESLQKGCDVMQMPNGDIVITEMRPVTLQYSWDKERSKLVRHQFGAKARKEKSKVSN